MEEPAIAQKEPIGVDVIPGRKYWWCACGRSQKQPFCDSSHKGTGFSPVMFETDTPRTVYFCCCKRSGNKPECDGTHNTL